MSLPCFWSRGTGGIGGTIWRSVISGSVPRGREIPIIYTSAPHVNAKRSRLPAWTSKRRRSFPRQLPNNNLIPKFTPTIGDDRNRRCLLWEIVHPRRCEDD